MRKLKENTTITDDVNTTEDDTPPRGVGNTPAPPAPPQDGVQSDSKQNNININPDKPTTITFKPKEENEKHSWIGRFTNSIFSKIFPQKLNKMIESTMWGMVEGYVTGTMLGAYNVGRGGWISVLIATTIGAPLGAMMGALGGGIMGAMTDKEKVSNTIKSYRDLPFDKDKFKNYSGFNTCYPITKT